MTTPKIDAKTTWLLLRMEQHANDYTELYTESAFISCVECSGKPGVHVEESFFRNTFKKYAVSEHGSKDYPYQLSFMRNGVRFFCLSDKE